MKETRSDRVAQANEILQLFEDHLCIFERRGRLWLAYDDGKWSCEKAAVLSRNGSSLACAYGTLGMGGTAASAVAMLVRWIRNDYRYSLWTWKYWVQPGVALARERGPELIAALEATTYGDPAKTGCTVCGRQMDPKDGLHWDWFSRKGETIGMQCDWGGCPQKREATQ